MKDLIKAYLDGNEAVEAEVKKDGVMLSEKDCLELMRRSVALYKRELLKLRVKMTYENGYPSQFVSEGNIIDTCSNMILKSKK